MALCTVVPDLSLQGGSQGHGGKTKGGGHFLEAQDANFYKEGLCMLYERWTMHNAQT